MDKETLKKLLNKKLSKEEIDRLEEILLEESMQKREKIEVIKKLIEEKKYNVDPEEVAEKMLKFFELEQED